MRSPTLGLSACLLGLWLCWGSPSWAQVLREPTQEQVLSQDEFLSRLEGVRVLYLGEVHNRPDDQAAQLQILQQWYEQNPELAIGLEMFERPRQVYIDQYLAGEISEAEFLELSEFETRWGFPWESYAPILRFAKAHNLPVLALNAPIEAIREVARGGFDNLSPQNLSYLPPVEEFDLENQAYRQRLQDLFESYHQGHGSSEGFETFFKAQVLWDETMSYHVAEFLQTHPERAMVVIAGQGHILYGDGIPSRVERRLEEIEQLSLVFDPDPTLSSTPERPLADIIWHHEDSDLASDPETPPD
ncbi:ChaN family lipoprotein [Phormidium yuhuli AB48]|uniref:ChaN family lipoprotein n=1 Tax=Phormidium yuhuli AB48 TaxID=2940671 RepID=A0ABY5AP90_9CYAN|nr:ChaN family lipoprotein [Phormidium yuhuli]USR90728.1 ChaN family lipoprotein [Phormidium yuhuli AB48]